IPLAASAAQPAKAPVVGAIGPSLVAVTCPSVTQCTAVDPDGEQLTFNPASSRAATARRIEPSFDPANAVVDVSCPATTQCTAVDVTGIEMTFDPQSSGRATSFRVDPNDVHSISCPTISQC